MDGDEALRSGRMWKALQEAWNIRKTRQANHED